jgi:hypothetical protein
MDDIQALYNGTRIPDTSVRVGTPDPTKYHDPATVLLEGDGRSIAEKSSVSMGLRGVVVPRATLDGASMGFDHEAPVPEVFIDPHLLHGKLRVDMARLREDGIVAQVFNEKNKQYVDTKDRSVAIFAAFADKIHNAHPVEEPISPPPVRSAQPAQVRGLRETVVSHTPPPQNFKVASFSSRPSSGFDQRVDDTARATNGRHQTDDNTNPSQHIEPAPGFAGAARTATATSLHAALSRPASGSTDAAMVSSSPAIQAARPMRSVMIEFPSPMGTYQAFYHEIIVSERQGSLFLAYDRNQPSQPLWIPPDPPVKENGEMELIELAMLVSAARPDEPDMLYRVLPTGERYEFGSWLFFLLTIDVSRELPKETEVTRGKASRHQP